MTEVQVDKIENFTPAYGSYSHLHRVECARIGLLRPLIILRCNHRSASCPLGSQAVLLLSWHMCVFSGTIRLAFLGV